jgi:hypothetical protein
MRGTGGITRRGFASLAAGALAACLCGCEAGGDPSGASGRKAQWFIIDSQGEPVGTAHFSDADGYGFASNGLAAVQDAETGLWGFVDESGAWVIQPKFRQVWEFAANGLAPAQDDGTGLWGYVDESGSWAIEPKYSKAWPFYDNGTAEVQGAEHGDTIWIDEKGNGLEGGSPRLQAVMDPETRLFGVMARDGTWALEPTYADLTTDGHSDLLLARPQGSDLCGVVDAGGGWVVGPAFADLVVAFDADPLAAKDEESGLWGYVGWDGGWVVQPAFAEATRMGDNGRALARAA